MGRFDDDGTPSIILFQGEKKIRMGQRRAVVRKRAYFLSRLLQTLRKLLESKLYMSTVKFIRSRDRNNLNRVKVACMGHERWQRRDALN